MNPFQKTPPTNRIVTGSFEVRPVVSLYERLRGSFFSLVAVGMVLLVLGVGSYLYVQRQSIGYYMMARLGVDQSYIPDGWMAGQATTLAPARSDAATGESTDPGAAAPSEAEQAAAAAAVEQQQAEGGYEEFGPSTSDQYDEEIMLPPDEGETFVGDGVPEYDPGTNPDPGTDPGPIDGGM